MKKNKFYGFNFATMSGIIMVAMSFALLILVKVLQSKIAIEGFKEYEMTLKMIQDTIINFENKWVIVLCSYALFALKSLIPLPIIPVSFVCVLSGVIFDWRLSVFINIIGLSIMFLIKYYHGKKHGGGVTHRFIKSYEPMRKMLEVNGKANPWILFFCRLLPAFPLNTISRICGSMDFDLKKYLVISIIGYIPKILFYTFIGRTVFDPLSLDFLMPIISLLFFFGIMMISINYLILFIKKKQDN
ncbi:hypothetical protein SDC9_145776 [bioreactor metagenome]|uniref:VTT domain-containing protein n=1 Tax=bioreactor metagenome TaxID=1076179 RepID=A0A645EBU8_9ZZZZ